MISSSRSFLSTVSPGFLRCQRQLSNSSRAKLQPKSPSKVFRNLAVGGTLTGLSVYGLDQYYDKVISRSFRAVRALLWVAYQYSSNASSYDSMHDLHDIAAEELLKMIEANKGLYIKLGQAIANQGTLFPIEYQRRFNRLYDNAPVDKWQDIDTLLKKNFGSDYETDMFHSIEHTPIASASIAQVHRAVLKVHNESNGTVENVDVAVKVQHPYVENQINVDLLVYRLITKVYERVFDIPMAFFSSYVSSQLEKETDFVNEQRNTEKLEFLLETDTSKSKYLQKVRVPKVYTSTRQVLIGEWIDGVSLSDKDKLIDQGFDLSLLMTQYLQSLAKQIFEYGFVHSDPHPGNLIARFNDKNVQELVILDHGLYVDLPMKFRNEYSRLFESIFQFNRSGIKEIADSWGIGNVEVFATLVQLRPIKMDGDSPDGNSKQDINDLLHDFLNDKSKFPLELIFISRTMRMMQNLNQTYGSPVNRISILTKESVSALLKDSKSRKDWFIQTLKFLPVRFAFFLNDLAFWFIRLRQVLLGDRYGGKKIGLEDYLETYMKNTAKSVGIEWVDESEV
ncbi:ABC1 family protein Mcp2p [[Candida] railenensis]|uniref:ABC1 family protein Mcp2p n=1 Tax=[Candida] railenensis TaxID=45579 RepID=A0A9P0QKE1_9ASCO|nr:ABC1 family protein Mcp2p [[Candida] railenensis]